MRKGFETIENYVSYEIITHFQREKSQVAQRKICHRFPCVNAALSFVLYMDIFFMLYPSGFAQSLYVRKSVSCLV